MYEVPDFFTSFPTLFILSLFLAILLDLKWYVIVLDLWTLYSVWLISVSILMPISTFDALITVTSE